MATVAIDTSARKRVTDLASLGADSGKAPKARDNDDSTQAILDAVLAGSTLREVNGISEEMMEGVYAHAYRFYQQGKLKEAEAFFRFLCVYDFYNPDYAMGLAAVFQLGKKYQQAIDLYALAFALGDKDYRPMFHAGQCNLLQRKLGPAKKCFRLVAEHATEAALRDQASACIDAIDTARRQGTEQAPGERKTGF